MKPNTMKCLFSTCLLGVALRSSGQVMFTGNDYTQDFDTLEMTGNADVILPAGWGFVETGSGADTTYRAGTGSSTTGDTYSFGSDGSTDRAFGTLRSGSVDPEIGAAFQNATGDPLSGLEVSFTGEQWRLGTAGRSDRLDFQYSLDAHSLSDGTWIDVDALDFTSPNTVATGALDGNAAGNRTLLGATLAGLDLPDGGTVWMRWMDFAASGSDDGLGIDDFRISAVPEPRESLMVIGLGLLGLAGFRWRAARSG
jgi:hypothetical protein